MSKPLAPVRVLVVDDDKAICEYMETFLTKDGFEVKTLSDPSRPLTRSRTAATTWWCST